MEAGQAHRQGEHPRHRHDDHTGQTEGGEHAELMGAGSGRTEPEAEAQAGGHVEPAGQYDQPGQEPDERAGEGPGGDHLRRFIGRASRPR